MVRYLGLLVLLCLIACGGGSGGTTTTPNTVYFGVVNIGYDAPGLETRVDGTLAATTAKGNYTKFFVPSGSKNINVRVGGTSTDIVNVTRTLTTDKTPFWVLTNPGIFLIDPFRLPTSNEAAVFFVNAGTEAVDAHLVLSTATTVDGAVQKWSNVAAGAIGEVILDKGTYKLFLTAPGSTTITGTSINLNAASGKTYGLFVKPASGAIETYAIPI